MEKLELILAYLAGKKASIASILGAIIVFLQGREMVANDTATLLSAILVALGLGANYAGYKIGKRYER